MGNSNFEPFSLITTDWDNNPLGTLGLQQLQPPGIFCSCGKGRALRDSYFVIFPAAKHFDHRLLNSRLLRLRSDGRTIASPCPEPGLQCGSPTAKFVLPRLSKQT